ncbi:outer membrane beta-barrel protein [Chitinophaga filiformis]|uniref:TonB-dependent receptor n=1 Tax=Chitinophaga filiformis TaxID=104663 RepID=A0ABY4I6G7_CHIFI|nr:outer membrane beta-barrel protein [Chitinophaga filiformis]UPK71675.1 TonB-dependent receptor [Chitinophaga filiformis]
MLQKTYFVFVILFIFKLSQGIAQEIQQPRLQLTGSVVSTAHLPIPYGSVFLESADSKDLNYRTSLDTTGKFIIGGVQAHIYRLKVISVGYKVFIKDNVVISDRNVVLPDIVLQDSTTNLKEVNISTGQIPVKSENGKLIIDATNKIYKTSANALDLISKLPSTSVAQDKITLNGTVEPVILIDGKRSPLSTQELKNIPASQIKKIELITNPGAEYEGNYNAIINISLNRGTPVDSSNVTGYAGYGRNRYNQVYSGIGYVHQKSNGHYFQANYDFSKYNGFLDFENQRQTDAGNSKNSYSETSFSKQRPTNHSLRLNYEKTLNDKSKLGADLRTFYGKYHENTNSASVLTSLVPAETPQQIAGNNDMTSRNASVAGNLFYQLKINERSEFNTQVNYGLFDQEQEQQIDIMNTTTDGFESIRNKVSTDIKLLTLNADYKTRLWNTFSLATGIKASTTSTDNNTNYDTLAGTKYVPDSSRINHFLYDEHILAGYVNIGREFKFVNVNAGVRYEYTKGTGELIFSKEKFNREYSNWLPYVNLSKGIFKNALQMNLSYSRKLQRPSYNDLNPFSIITSPYTRSEGNPYLTPALFDNYELNLNYKNINLNVSYRKKNDLISQIPVYDFDTQILVLKMENINDRASWSYNLSYTKALTKWYTLQLSANLLNDEFNTVVNGKNYHRQGNNFTISSSNAFTLMPGFIWTLSGMYSSSAVYNIYKFKPQGYVTTGFRKEFFNKKVVLVAEFRDMFLTMKDRLTQSTDGFYSTIRQFRGSRSLDVRLEFDLRKITQTIKSLNIPRSEEESRVKN